MSRTWLSPRMRKAILAIDEETAQTRVGWVPEARLYVIIGSYAGNVIKALVDRGLISLLERELTGSPIGYELTPYGEIQRVRLRRQLERTVAKSAAARRVG